LCLIGALITPLADAAAQDQKASSASPALDVQTLEPTEHFDVDHRRLLFATNRRILPSGKSAARQKRGGSVRYETIFSTTLDASLGYGWLEVGFPSDRAIAEQSYNAKPGEPNSFVYFSIEGYGLAGGRPAARSLSKDPKFNGEERALVYVHGINNSFRDAAERLTQLVVDLKIPGTPVLFSWPADANVIPLIEISPEAYRKTLLTAQKSHPYLAQAIDDLLFYNAGRFDLVAHSMGNLIAFKVLKERPPYNLGTLDPTAPPAVTLPNVILAAPDVGMKDFLAGREELLKKSRRLTVYCSSDKALFISRIINGDDRVGYCSDPKQRKDYLDGVEFVRVFGNLRDIPGHSYYINTPEIVTDIKDILSMTRTVSDFPTAVPVRYREIFVNY
jgi:esterase/lipase superfamily enzyme